MLLFGIFIMKWTKQDKYYATCEGFTMSWLDTKPKRFTLYKGNTMLEHGSREACLSAFEKNRAK